MDYETSVQIYQEKQILNDFKQADGAPIKMSEADKDDNNSLFMTIEDMRAEKIVDNFICLNETE